MPLDHAEEDPKLTEWKVQLGTIGDHVLQLHHHRQIWRALTAAIAANDDGEIFADHYTTLYVDGAAMAVRRLADPSGRSRKIALGRLLKDILAHPNVLTRERHIARYDDPDDPETEHWLQHGAEEWDDNFADADGNLGITRIQSDLDQLATAVTRVKEFADRRVAHIDGRGVEIRPRSPT